MIANGVLGLPREEWEGENFAICKKVPGIVNSGYCYL